MSNFTMTTHRIWSCHVTLATNFENFYFLPKSILNFRKVTKFGGNWCKNKKGTGKKTKFGVENTPSAYKVKVNRVDTWSLLKLGPIYFSVYFATSKCLLFN